MNRNNLALKNPTRFGSRISASHPTFELGEFLFATKLITVGEDRVVTQLSRQVGKKEKDADGVEIPQSDEQELRDLELVAEMLSPILKRRLLIPANEDTSQHKVFAEDPHWVYAATSFSENEYTAQISDKWIVDNMTNNDFGPMFYFLRQGVPFVADLDDLDLDAAGEADPNADNLPTTTG